MSIEMIEIIPKVETPIIIETLSRIGIANKKEKILYPSCYLYIKANKYYICHFKELFLLREPNSGYSNVSEDDIIRKKSIINLLEKWNLIEVIPLENIDTIFVFTIAHKDKSSWTIKHKINLDNI